MNIGNIYYRQNNYNSALENYLLALKIQEDIGNKRDIVGSYMNIGRVFIKQKKYNNAKKYLAKALQESREMKYKDQVRECYSSLAELAEATGNYKNAYAYHRLFSEVKDSLLNENNNKQIAEMKTKYETAKKDNEIKAQETEVKKQKVIKYAAFSFAALILLIAIISFNNIRIKNKAAHMSKTN